MKRFKYRLQKVLQYRDVVKADRKRELLNERMKLMTLSQDLEDLKEQQERNELEGSKQTDLAMQMMMVAYSQRIMQQISWQELKVKEQDQVVQQALKAYVEASRDAKALELHRAKQLTEYGQYIEREEGKVLDEQIVQRSGRTESE